MLSRISFVCAALAAIVAAACDTVPLTAPTGSTVTVSAANSFVQLGGTTEVTAFVVESAGTAVQNGTTVHFSTNLGRVDPIDVQTKNGYATTTFIAGDVSGLADVVATSGGSGGTTTTPPTTGDGSNNGGATTPPSTNSNAVRITVGSAAADNVVLNASATSVPVSGGTVTLIASVLDANGNRLTNTPVNFSTDAGTLSATLATTDAKGEAAVQLTTNRDATVTARVGTKSTTLRITVNGPANVTLSGSSSTVPSSGGTITLRAVVLDVAGNRLPNAQVNFSTTSGTLSATQVTTDGNGEAQVTLTTSAAATVTARAGTATATFAVTVGSSVSLSVNPTSGTIATMFTFTVTPAPGATSVNLDFGDGASQSFGGITSPQTATHSYGTPGQKNAQVTQSGTGGSSSATVVVTVN
jgi:hypothetical protein